MLNSIHTNETFRPVKGYEDLYQISNLGNIHNNRKLMKIQKHSAGYLHINLTKDGKSHTHLIHRLVAIAFLDNPQNKPEVNHDDGNKHNNILSNLEWNTSVENKQHAITTGLKIYNNPTLGIKLSKKSKYYNVGWDKSRNKWNAAVRLNGKTYYQKRFDKEIDAAKHVNWIIDKLGLANRPKNNV